MEPLTVIFIGPQGSGKGTQIAKLKAVIEARDSKRRVVDIQTGRRFRALAQKQETFAEEKVAKTLDTGILQPDFLVAVLWGEAMIGQLDPKSHLLIDGFPRNARQARELESALDFFERSSVVVINLNTPEDVVRKRMEERARLDDTEGSIEARLRWYREETLPLVEYYKERDHTTVLDIDGTDTIEGVHSAILKGLEIS